MVWWGRREGGEKKGVTRRNPGREEEKEGGRIRLDSG